MKTKIELIKNYPVESLKNWEITLDILKPFVKK